MALSPWQIVSLQVITAIGLGETVTVAVAMAVQLPAFVTVTVYAVVLIGEEVMEGVVAPLLQLYVPPPVAVRVVLSAVHKTVLPVMDAMGLELTVAVAAAVTVQPLASVTVTV